MQKKRRRKSHAWAPLSSRKRVRQTLIGRNPYMYQLAIGSSMAPTLNTKFHSWPPLPLSAENSVVSVALLINKLIFILIFF